MELKYKFDDFDWLADMAGFNKPTDVYYGNILLGVIVSKPTGYVIDRVIDPERSVIVTKSKNNHFKSKNQAATILHRLWKLRRTHT